MRWLFIPILALACTPPDEPEDTQTDEGETYTFQVYWENAIFGDGVDGATVSVHLDDGTLLTATADDSGLATVDDVIPPFTVTGQFSDGGFTIATSLRIDDTEARAFGIELFAGGLVDEDFTETAGPMPTTVLSGEITNVPAIPAGYELILSYKVEDNGRSDQVLLGPGTPATASVPYTVPNVPAGPMAVWAAIQRDYGAADQWGSEIQELAYLNERLDVSEGQTNNVPVLDFDGNEVVTFSEQSFSITSALADAEQGALDLWIESIQVPIGFWGQNDYSGGVSEPSTLFLPDSAADGVYASFYLDGEDWRQYATTPPGNGTFDMVRPIDITGPLNGTTIPEADVIGGEITFSPGPDAVSLQAVGIAGENALWLFPVTSSTTSITIPETAAPVLSTGDYEIIAYNLRGPTTDLSIEEIADPNSDGINSLAPRNNSADSDRIIGVSIQ